MDLADDEVIHMLGFLPAKGLCSVALTCDRFHKLANYGPVLRQLLMSVFGLSADYVPPDSGSDGDRGDSDSDNNGPSSSASSFYKEKYIAQNSMLQWSREFHHDEIVISPDGKTTSLDDDSDYGGFLSKVSLKNDTQSRVYFEVQISVESYESSFGFGVQDIRKSTNGINSNSWRNYYDHYIRLFHDGEIHRTGRRNQILNLGLKFEDGDFFGFVLDQGQINENNANENEKEKDEKNEKKEHDYGFIAFYKNGVKITEDIKLFQGEAECDFYAYGYMKHEGVSFTIQDKPSFLPPLK